MSRFSIILRNLVLIGLAAVLHSGEADAKCSQDADCQLVNTCPCSGGECMDEKAYQEFIEKKKMHLENCPKVNCTSDQKIYRRRACKCIDQECFAGPLVNLKKARKKSSHQN